MGDHRLHVTICVAHGLGIQLEAQTNKHIPAVRFPSSALFIFRTKRLPKETLSEVLDVPRQRRYARVSSCRCGSSEVSSPLVDVSKWGRPTQLLMSNGFETRSEAEVSQNP